MTVNWWVPGASVSTPAPSIVAGPSASAVSVAAPLPDSTTRSPAFPVFSDPPVMFRLPTVSVAFAAPVPTTAVPPLTVSPTSVSLKSFVSNSPSLLTVTFPTIWSAASSRATAVWSISTLSPTTRLPATAFTPAVLFSSSVPSFTVVVPV